MLEQFKSEFAHSLERCLTKRLVFLGIGNELRHDDAAGLVIIEKLRPRVKDPTVTMLNCADIPENFTGHVKRIDPACIVLIDAADFGGDPGEAHVFALSDIEKADISTHKASLAVLGAYLRSETGASVFVIGIQPDNTEFGSGLTQTLHEASESIVGAISTVLNHQRTNKA
ncbi:MAG: hydrogenase 3 maturation endopeptidase HyCI [Halobacteriota archaeon]